MPIPKSLNGFRDFTPADCAVRNYFFETFRRVAQTYGFSEYETPLVESTDIYLKKSGDELPTQLFRFEDQGGRDVTLRPEVTASLARVAAKVQREYQKPMKWFEIGQCFRYERPQKGRGREFYQFNVDILGEADPAADAELMAFAIDTMRALGFTDEDFVLRLSDREAWMTFCAENDISEPAQLLAIVDKLERTPAEKVDEQLAPLGITREQLDTFIATGSSPALDAVRSDLKHRGLLSYTQTDLSIVRGLAYYTGVVFEIFDRKKDLRAIAGGGRYDTLISTMSDGAVDLPATGFAMGDMVIRHLVEATPHALAQMEGALMQQARADVYLVVSDEENRADALQLLAQLREAGISTDIALTRAKYPKQLKAASEAKARLALIIDRDFPEIRVKHLRSDLQESLPPNTNIVTWVTHTLAQPHDGNLLA